MCLGASYPMSLRFLPLTLRLAGRAGRYGAWDPAGS
jgi:hypothetical protein